MKYIIVDAYLNGTGIRDKYSSGFIAIQELHLSSTLSGKLQKWLDRYWLEFYKGYSDPNTMMNLDKEGIEIAIDIRQALPQDSKIEYYSDAFMKMIPF